MTGSQPSFFHGILILNLPTRPKKANTYDPIKKRKLQYTTYEKTAYRVFISTKMDEVLQVHQEASNSWEYHKDNQRQRNNQLRTSLKFC